MIDVVNVELEAEPELEKQIPRDDGNFHHNPPSHRNPPSHLVMCSTCCNEDDSNVFLLRVVLQEVNLLFGVTDYAANLRASADKQCAFFLSCHPGHNRLFQSSYLRVFLVVELELVLVVVDFHTVLLAHTAHGVSNVHVDIWDTLDMTDKVNI